MNRLFLSRCYLCGAISLATDAGLGWRQFVRDQLKDLDLIWMDPTEKATILAPETAESLRLQQTAKQDGRFDELTSMMKTVRNIDLRMVDVSDFIIAHLDLNVYTVGTYDELFEANRQHKPIIIHIAQGKHNLPSWLFGTLSHEMVFSQWDVLFDYVRHIASTSKPLNDKRWKFFDYGRLYGVTR